MVEDGNVNSNYSKFSYNWRNFTSVLRWNRVFSSTMFANFLLYNSNFRQNYINKFDRKGTDEYRGYNNLNDWSIKGNFDWTPNTVASFKYGYQLSFQKFSPEIISFKTDSFSLELNKDIATKNIVYELYFEGDIKISDKLETTIGIRGGNLKSGEKKYRSIQPRFSMRYGFSEKLFWKLSYSRMKQYLHQLQNTTLGIPTELWVSSTDKIKPGTSDLFSTGIFLNPDKNLKFSVETFYTNLQNVIRYKDGTRALKERDESWENFVATGKGKSFGIEFMTEKSTGKFTGWLSYTISKSTRQFDEINFGRPFPYAYDRRHQININANRLLKQINQGNKTIRRSISSTFNFASGKYMTLAEQQYQSIPLPLMEGSRYNSEWFAQRSLINTVNNYKMPDFHNLSISYRVERQTENKSVTWDFSVYNAYNRLNPWYYYKDGNQMKQITLFPIIPSVSFTYKW